MLLAAGGPNWAEVVTALATSALAVGVLVALFQLGELKRDRHLQWIFEIGRRWDEEKLVASREAMFTIYAVDETGAALADKMRLWLGQGWRTDETLEKEMTVLLKLPTFFENVSTMVRFGRLDGEFVWQTLSGPVALAWQVWEPAVKVYRDLSDAAAFTEFEALAGALAKYERERDTVLGGTLQTSSFRMVQLTQRLASYAIFLFIVSIVLVVAIFMK